MGPSQESTRRQEAGTTQDADTVTDVTLHDRPLNARRNAVSPLGWMSCSELAAHFKVNGELLRPRLNRLRAQDPTCYKELADSAGGEPRYLFSVEKARPIIESMKGGMP